MIEESLNRLSEAIEKLTAALQSHQTIVATSAVPQSQPEAVPTKTRKAKTTAEPTAEATPPAPTPEPAKPTGPTVADLRAMAQQILDAGQPEKLRELNKKYGCRASECPPERIGEFHADLKAAIEPLAAV